MTSLQAAVDDRPREECGVCAVVGHDDAATLCYLGLYAQQHRGQETAGIVSARLGDHGGIQHRVHRGLGLVPDVFDQQTLADLGGRVCIGHVRYSTTGAPNPQNTQPIAASLRFGPVAVAHNGNLTNAHLLRASLKSQGAIFGTTIDTEVIVHLISHVMTATFEEAMHEALQSIEGAFSLVILHNDTMYAVRDAHGFRPLELGRLPNGGWMVASETVAFDLVDAKPVRSIAPGEILRIRPGAEPETLKPLPARERAQCIFEYVYFSRPDSVIDGVAVQAVRRRMGEELFREHPAEADAVICVPDSAMSPALGYAHAGSLPFVMGLVRNHYVGRTFIEPTQRIRDFGAKVKYNATRSAVAGKRLVVVDDSIVRGTTAQKIVRMLRDAGATEIHFRIASPPWRHSCLYGIDTPDPRTFAATGRDVEQIRAHLEVDSLGYLSPDGLKRAVGRQEGWCMACFTGRYPTSERRLTKEMLEDQDLSFGPLPKQFTSIGS
ncbi:MAG: amidophosphoribosyltransferase [Candidatus Sumerlaeia bacterium]|nr:amidophosphoribosyltransferase [Candidatus Sumerlaeia bacterium]